MCGRCGDAGGCPQVRAGALSCAFVGDPQVKEYAGGCRQDDVSTPEKVELAPELGREGNRVYPGALGSGHWVQSLAEGSLRRLLCVLGPNSVWVLHASLQVEFQKELGL